MKLVNFEIKIVGKIDKKYFTSDDVCQLLSNAIKNRYESPNRKNERNINVDISVARLKKVI